MRIFILLAAALLTSVSAWAIRITWGPYLQRVGTDEAMIVWGTDADGVAWVETAPDDNLHFYAEERPKFYDTYLGRKKIGRLHHVRVTGLKPATTYRYRVFTQEVLDKSAYRIDYGPVASTRVYQKEPLRFTTLDPAKDKISFRMVNDIHADTTRLAKLLTGVRRGAGTDFVLYNGDMVSHMDDEPGLMAGFINKSVEIFASEVPFYMVRGNHEGRGLYADEYLSYFPAATQMPYYAFRQGPVYFVVLDGGEDKPDSDIEYLGRNRMDDYRLEQARWLRSVVESPEFKAAPYKVAVVHVPPLGSTWHGPLHSKKLFMPILNDAGIDLMLCGHLHQHVYIPAGEDGNNFPILINSNKEALHATADRKSLEISVCDIAGKELKHFSYPAR